MLFDFTIKPVMKKIAASAGFFTKKNDDFMGYAWTSCGNVMGEYE